MALCQPASQCVFARAASSPSSQNVLCCGVVSPSALCRWMYTQYTQVALQQIYICSGVRPLQQHTREGPQSFKPVNKFHGQILVRPTQNSDDRCSKGRPHAWHMLHWSCGQQLASIGARIRRNCWKSLSWCWPMSGPSRVICQANGTSKKMHQARCLRKKLLPGLNVPIQCPANGGIQRCLKPLPEPRRRSTQQLRWRTPFMGLSVLRGETLSLLF